MHYLYKCIALLLFVGEHIALCISFLSSTILQLSCILSSLMSPPQHWELQIAIDRIAESGKTCINSPPWPSFISLITRGIQRRILGRYFQCSDLLQIQLEESFPGSLDTEGASVLFEYFMAIILTTKIQSNIPFKLKSLRESVLNSLVFRLPNPKLLY